MNTTKYAVSFQVKLTSETVSMVFTNTETNHDVFHYEMSLEDAEKLCKGLVQCVKAVKFIAGDKYEQLELPL